MAQGQYRTEDHLMVKAAQNAIETREVNIMLPWFQKQDEQELRNAFDAVVEARSSRVPPKLVGIVDKWFFDTLIRLYKGNDLTNGAIPKAIDDPLIGMAQKSLEDRNAEELIELLTDTVNEELHNRFENALAWQQYDKKDIEAGRQFVHATLDFVLYVHHLCQFLKSVDVEMALNKDPNMVSDEKRRSEIIKRAKMLGHNYHR